MLRKKYGCGEEGRIGAKKAITTLLFHVYGGDDEEWAELLGAWSISGFLARLILHLKPYHTLQRPNKIWEGSSFLQKP